MGMSSLLILYTSAWLEYFLFYNKQFYLLKKRLKQTKQKCTNIRIVICFGLVSVGLSLIPQAALACELLHRERAAQRQAGRLGCPIPACQSSLLGQRNS